MRSDGEPIPSSAPAFCLRIGGRGRGRGRGKCRGKCRGTCSRYDIVLSYNTFHLLSFTSVDTICIRSVPWTSALVSMSNTYFSDEIESDHETSVSASIGHNTISSSVQSRNIDRLESAKYAKKLKQHANAPSTAAHTASFSELFRIFSHDTLHIQDRPK